MKKIQDQTRLINEGSPQKQDKITQIQWLVNVLVQIKERKQEVINIKSRLEKKFKDMSVPMDKVEYTQEKYDKLFPNGKVNTPIGDFTLEKKQFKKLENKKRKEYLGGMLQTYKDPIAIIHKLDKNGKPSKLFGKSFNELLPYNKILASAINHKNEGITTHNRDQNDFLGNLKKPSDLLFEKQNKGDTGTAGDDT